MYVSLNKKKFVLENDNGDIDGGGGTVQSLFKGMLKVLVLQDRGMSGE